ncbi:alpha-1,3-mannosyltransferase CMT1 [Ceratobasidium sp. AG-Ba]|nr:alpha-1,3-mannosyltransferase CMT1 [Ceratobasidium sp. AG-Ba]QRW09935.1 alpha-1,3-mannosyltransferase CMT1 [Ceratobasidium sp. AG-Ba]
MPSVPGVGAVRSSWRRWRRTYIFAATAISTIVAYILFLSLTTPQTQLERTVRALRALPNDFASSSVGVRHKRPDAKKITNTLAVVDSLRYEFDRQDRQHESNYMKWLTSSFSAARTALRVEPLYPSCTRPAASDLKELRQTGRVFIAVNLLQNEELMPTLTRQLLALSEVLGPERLFVSIYENASMDLTVMHLRLLCKILDAAGTPYRVIARGLTELQHKEDGHRISRLAHLRNTVLEPLFMTHGKFETVLFLNDVFFCYGDVIELLLQKKRNNATQLADFARPFYRQQDLVEFFGPPDDIEQKPRPQILPEPADSKDRLALGRGDPFQVFSCWNGVTAISASAFAPPTSLRFRTAHNDPNSKDGATDKASECYLSSVDLWKAGSGRVMVVPRTRVAYYLDVYNADRAPSAYNSTSMSSPLIKWSPTPPAEVVMHDFGMWFAPETKEAWDSA